MKSIRVKNVKKVYPLYNSKRSKVKEALSLSGKSYHSDFYALLMSVLKLSRVNA